MSSLAIIPARGGSKRIPRKNLRDFCGRPVIAWPIEAAIRSGCFDEVMVSTDDDEIATFAESCGASVPFRRSDSASSDDATTSAVFHEVLSNYAEKGKVFDLACGLYATAALVTPEMILDAFRLLVEHPETEGALTLIRTPQSAKRSLVVRDGSVEFLFPDQFNTRSQDLATTYFDAGQMYWVRPAQYLAKNTIPMSCLHRIPIVVEEFMVQDINTLDDWAMAEAKMAFRNSPTASAAPLFRERTRLQLAQ